MFLDNYSGWQAFPDSAAVSWHSTVKRPDCRTDALMAADTNQRRLSAAASFLMSRLHGHIGIIVYGVTASVVKEGRPAPIMAA